MKIALIALMITSVLFYSCKEEDIIYTPDLASTQSCLDHLIAENMFNDVEMIIKEGLQNNGQNKSFPTYNIMNLDTSDIDTLIINFGSENYLYNGKLRNGKLNITYTGKYHTPYSIITTTFDNYHVNNNLIQGRKTITNQGINNDGNIWFTINIDSASIGTSSGRIDWQSSTVKIWTKGENTYNILDDEYKVTGSASGNGANGNSFTMTITDTLNIDLGCFPSCIIKKGTAIISPSNYSNRVINYGDTLCDCNFSIIIDDKTYPLVITN